MNEVVREWIDKSPGGLPDGHARGPGRSPNYDAVCFHAQPCIEKLLKAAVIIKGAIPAKTHDLTVLSGLTGG